MDIFHNLKDYLIIVALLIVFVIALTLQITLNTRKQYKKFNDKKSSIDDTHPKNDT